MKHLASRRFWRCYDALPKEARDLADRSFELLKEDPRHPSLRFKKVAEQGRLWSVRVGLHYRALGVEMAGGIARFWIGIHADYDRIIG